MFSQAKSTFFHGELHKTGAEDLFVASYFAPIQLLDASNFKPWWLSSSNFQGW